MKYAFSAQTCNLGVIYADCSYMFPHLSCWALFFHLAFVQIEICYGEPYIFIVI